MTAEYTNATAEVLEERETGVRGEREVGVGTRRKLPNRAFAPASEVRAIERGWFCSKRMANKTRVFLQQTFYKLPAVSIVWCPKPKTRNPQHIII